MKHAIVLLSGGMDSATCFAQAIRDYDRVTPVHFHYGQQTADLEFTLARRLVSHFKEETGPDTTIDGIKFLEYQGVFSHFAEGVAGDRDSFTTEEGSLEEEDGRSTGYVPMRNLHFIASGAGMADHLGADAVFHGAQAGDEAAYPDCRPVFMHSAQDAINESLPEGQEIQLETPVLKKSKVEVIQLGEELGVPWQHTYSCYTAVEDLDAPKVCGSCPACVERGEAFLEAGVHDPHDTDVLIRELEEANLGVE